MQWVLLGVLVGVPLFALLFGIGAYNRLVALRNRFQNAFAQIDVQLRRRYDLIPNLIETAKAYLSHERETLEAVTQARTNAMSAEKQLAADPGNTGALSKLIGAEGALTGALGRLFAVAESYPDLKANQNMMQLSEELTATENKVAFSRQAYNDSVMSYNTARESFPTTLVAGTFGFDEAPLFEVVDDSVREAPKVSFG